MIESSSALIAMVCEARLVDEMPATSVTLVTFSNARKL